jgi:hypothetical protein
MAIPNADGRAVFADAFFFVALLNPRDSSHAPARRVMVPRLDRALLTTGYVLLEVADALSTSPRNRQAVVSLFALLRSHPSVEVIPTDPELFDRGLDLYS